MEIRNSYKKILTQRNAHEVLRYQLELSIETTPRDSRYSQQLVDMMRKEENYVREGRPTTDLSKKVDDALELETTSFFEKVVQSNTKRWNTLSTKLDNERENLRTDIMRSSYNQRSASNGVVQSTGISLDPIAVEERRLEQIYNQRWYEFEGFSLEEAFRAQKARLDAEWDSHRCTLSDSYRTRKKTLMGSDVVEASTNEKPRSAKDVRWHDAEKQKTLIHTAPVLSPKALDMNKDATDREKAVGSAVRAVRNRAGEGATSAVQQQLKLELENLEAEYQRSLDAMDHQKSGAMRWMNRQKIRLMAQARVVQSERRVIGAFIHVELDHMSNMLRLLNETPASTPTTHDVGSLLIGSAAAATSTGTVSTAGATSSRLGESTSSILGPHAESSARKEVLRKVSIGAAGSASPSSTHVPPGRSRW